MKLRKRLRRFAAMAVVAASAAAATVAPVAFTGTQAVMADEVVTLSKDSVEMKAGSFDVLVARVDKDTLLDKILVWDSSDPKVARVTGGIVHAVGEGTAVITAMTRDGKNSAVCKVVVTEGDSNFTQDIIADIAEGGVQAIQDIKAAANLVKAAGVSFITENENIAKIQDGVIKAVNEGKTKLFAVAEDGTKTLIGTINVIKEKAADIIPVAKVKFEEAKTTITEGASKVIKTVIEPFNATDKSLIWTVDNPDIAKVVDGVVTAVKEGSTKIKAMTPDGKVVAEMIIDVVRDKLSDIVNRNGVWTYTVAGIPDYTYTGFARNKNGWWYVENGIVTFKKNDILQGTVDNTNAWWNIKDSKVVFNTTIENNVNGWWYIKDGKVDFNYTGFASNYNGWWYIENGKVTFNKNDVILGKVGGRDGWWNVKGSKVIFNTTVENNKNGWWYIKNGKVDFNYNGFANNRNGWWYIENGKVTFNKNDVILGYVEGKGGWWNVKGSKVIFNTTIENNVNGWWYIKDGKVDFNYTGFAKNYNGWWYVENGNVTFKKNGNIRGTINGRNAVWTVLNSKVTGV